MIKALKKVMAWVGIILLIMLAGSIWVMLKYTLVNPFIFLGIILAVALIVTLLLARYKRLIRATSNTAVNFLATTAAAFIALSGIIVSLNFFTADFDDVNPEKVKIERKYQKTRHHSRRSGRRSYERGESYQAYFLQLDLPYVGTRELEITRKLYSKTNKGDTVSLRIAKGCFQIPVINPPSIEATKSVRKKVGFNKAR